MSVRPSSPQALFAEMKRRRVFRVMAVYGAVAFVILQLADIAFEPLGLPAWAMTFVLVLAMIGFPIAIVLAWAFESTPDGVKRTEPARPEEIEAIVAEPRSRRWPSGLLALASVILLFGAGWWFGGAGREADVGSRGSDLLVGEARAADIRALAALPFENVNQSDENRLIAFGIHEDLLTQLSRIGALRVTSRTSVADLSDEDLSARDIADLLGVDYLLEGSVRSAGEQVVVNVTLVDAASGETVWSDRFDERVTPEDLLDMQARIARQVTQALQAQLTPDESAALAAVKAPASSTAQQWYYRAIDAFTSSPEGARNARDAARRAVDIDSGYVAAWALLARFESRLAWLGEDRREPAREAVERTEALAAGSPEAHFARGYFEYYVEQAFDAALDAFRAAERLAPSNAEVKSAVGLILRRQGDWEGSTNAMKEAVLLDPRNIEPLSFLSENLEFMGAHESADAVIERALAVNPSDPEMRSGKVSNMVRIDRDIGRAQRLADELALDPSTIEEGAILARLKYLDGDYEGYLATLNNWSAESGFFQMALALWVARGHRLRGDDESTVAKADSALRILSQAPLRDSFAHELFAGWAHALAGRRETALPHLAEAERELRAWEDHVDPANWAVDLAHAYALIGEIDRGLAVLEELTDRPSRDLSVADLSLDPAFAPYRGNPRFDDLVERRKRFEREAAEWAEANGPWLP